MVQCACIQPKHMINLFEINFQTGFRLNFYISKLDLGSQINSNGFSRDRSFQHKQSGPFWAVLKLL